MKQRKKKHIILKRMKKFLKFIWKFKEYHKKDKQFAESARNIFSSHDTFMRKIEGQL